MKKATVTNEMPYRKISFVDALSRIIITGDLNNIPAISFDSDFQTLGLPPPPSPESWGHC
jgi:predicted nucleic acid-binding protein